MAKAIKIIGASDLQPGDVLLSAGTEWISKAIIKMAGGSYSHSSVWDGHDVIGAITRGVVRDALKNEVGAQAYVDAYRWRPVPAGGHELGDARYPAVPVLAEAGKLADGHYKFAYDELMLAGLVVLVSKANWSPWMRAAARVILSKLDAWVHEVVVKLGYRGMMCTEVVCTSYWKAPRPHDYAISIRLDAPRTAHLLSVAGLAPMAPPGAFATASAVRELSDDQVRQRCGQLFVAALTAAGPASLRPAAAVAFRGGGTSDEDNDYPIITPAGGPLLPLGCVTPRDLEESRSLKLVGRIRLAPARAARGLRAVKGFGSSASGRGRTGGSRRARKRSKR